MKNLFLTIISLLFGHLLAACSPLQAGTNRSSIADTCADPSLTALYISAFSISRTAHVVRVETQMITYDATVGSTDNYQFQGPSFRAWPTAQDFTVPFHQLVTSNGKDVIVLAEVNGKPPTASGFIDQGIVGYAYSTQVCGSVPLLAAFNSAASDHWWTTNADDHARMLATGWVDAGIPFYVLPLGLSFPQNLS